MFEIPYQHPDGLHVVEESSFLERPDSSTCAIWHGRGGDGKPDKIIIYIIPGPAGISFKINLGGKVDIDLNPGKCI